MTKTAQETKTDSAQVCSQRASEVGNYPFLNAEEFAETCHFFDRQYRQATLGPIRRRWRLRICETLAGTFMSETGSSTYIQITRPLETTLDDSGLSFDIDKFSFGDGPLMEDQVMADEEEEDDAALERDILTEMGRVVYEIHLHPTYRMPCLWFTLRDLPASEPAFDMETVFRRLVPDEFKATLRGSGIGGISGDHHPVTGVPSFFVHPCLVGDSMSNFDCTKENYLMVWLGLVGGCVGLWVPKEMAFDEQERRQTAS